jgi:hypothetical protein
VTRVLAQQLGLTAARVSATEGGRRGLRVQVALPASARDAVAEVERALSAFLFECQVGVD